MEETVNEDEFLPLPEVHPIMVARIKYFLGAISMYVFCNIFRSIAQFFDSWGDYIVLLGNQDREKRATKKLEQQLDIMEQHNAN